MDILRLPEDGLDRTHREFDSRLGPAALKAAVDEGGGVATDLGLADSPVRVPGQRRTTEGLSFAAIAGYRAGHKDAYAAFEAGDMAAYARLMAETAPPSPPIEPGAQGAPHE